MTTETLTRLIELADGHQAADEYKPGSYQWDNGSCSIGCTTRDAQSLGFLPRNIYPGDHASLEKLGIPELVWRMCDHVFEGLPTESQPAWTPKVLRSIRADADYSNLVARIMARLARKLGEDAIDPSLKPICEKICALWTRRANGDDPSTDEWQEALQQAGAAGRQADAAGRQADAALQQAGAAWRQAGAALQQAGAAWRQADAALRQADAAWRQAYALRQADAAWRQADAAWRKFWSWCGEMLCEELARV
jgi:hypothetical protein